LDNEVEFSLNSKFDRPVLVTNIESVLKHLEKNPSDFDNKRIHEMFIGWLISQFLAKEQRSKVCIMYPLVKGFETILGSVTISFPELMSIGDKIIDDRETDIFIGNDDFRAAFQLVRFFKHPKAKRIKRLAVLIKHKCLLYKPSSNLILVVSLESSPDITSAELIEIMKPKAIPFKNIILIRKEPDGMGKFSIVQIYPTFVQSKIIDTGLLI
jgi:hypothetical protein